MKLVKLCVLILGLGWGLVCWGQPSGSVDPGEGYFQRGQFESAVREREVNRSDFSVCVAIAKFSHRLSTVRAVAGGLVGLAGNAG